MFFTMPPKKIEALDLPRSSTPHATFLSFCDKLPVPVLDRARRIIEHADTDGFELGYYAEILLTSGELFRQGAIKSAVIHTTNTLHRCRVEFEPFHVYTYCKPFKIIIFDNAWAPLEAVDVLNRNWEPGDIVNLAISENIDRHVYSYNTTVSETGGSNV